MKFAARSSFKQPVQGFVLAFKPKDCARARVPRLFLVWAAKGGTSDNLQRSPVVPISFEDIRCLER